MKNKALLLLMSISFFACEQSKPKVDYVLFSGKIEKPNGEKVMVMGNDFKKEMELKDGAFSDTLKNIEAGYYHFFDGREGSVMYLEPGYEIQMTLNTEEFDETIKYTGFGAGHSNYLAKKFLVKEQEDGEDPSALYSLTEEEFLSKLEQKRKLVEDLLGTSDSVEEHFVTLERKNIHYEHLSELKNYPYSHGRYTQQKDFEPSPDFLAEVEKLPLDNEVDFKTYEAYQGLVSGKFYDCLSKNKPLECLESLKSIKSEHIKNSILQRAFAWKLSPSSEEPEALYAGIMEVSTDTAFNASLTKKYEKVLKLKKGEPSPVFTFSDVNGKSVSLADLKGKNVYIDVWATWCGPCKREIPHLKTLEEEFRGKNIEFVSISVDKAEDTQKWKDMVKEEELKGIQLIADRDWTSDFISAYAIQGIPRFILVDAEGKIVSADASRPSSGDEIREAFEGLKL